MEECLDDRPSSQLRRRGSAIWTELHRHPFILQLGDGSLATESFKFFIEQDYKFLVEYVRVLGYGVSRSAELGTMRYYADLLKEVLDGELQACRQSALDLGFELSELENGHLAPATQSYADFLIRVASQGESVELPAGILPCSWSYVEIGQELSAKRSGGPAIYREWIDSYSSPAMVETAEACRELVDRSLRGAGKQSLDRATAAFLTSSRYELAFWEAALRRQTWTV
jgi:thiaminase (transcriptional activator TenA)